MAPEIPSPPAISPEALEVARYAASLAAQLEAMAVAAHLDHLAYFLGLAKAEGELFVRSNAQADGSKGD
jgi:hypothetical protein